MFRRCSIVSILSLFVLLPLSQPGMARPASTDKDANIRSSASLQSKVLSVLPPKSEVEVLNLFLAKDSELWYYVNPKQKGAARGWIRSDLIRFKPSNQIFGTLTGARDERINIRTTPQGKILHYGLPGDLVTVGKSAKGKLSHRWYRVTFPSNASGWVREDLLSLWPKGCIITCPDD